MKPWRTRGSRGTQQRRHRLTGSTASEAGGVSSWAGQARPTSPTIPGGGVWGPPHRRATPDASRSVVPARGAGASAARVAHGPGGRGTSAGSGFQPRGPPPHATVASRLLRSSGCRDRSGYTAPPAGGNARTGIAGPVDPCAPAGIAEGAGRTRPSGPNYVGTAFIGTVQDTARSQQLLGE